MGDRHAITELTRLEEQAPDGVEIAVDRVVGQCWRAGFLSADELGEAVFVLHASGPDRARAIRRLAELCG